MKKTTENLMNAAKRFLTVALQEYSRGKRRKNDVKIRQGAEKAWNAAVQATKALAAKRGRRIPRSYNAQAQFLLQFEKEHPESFNGTPFLLQFFKSFARGLHGECFYHGEYILEELDHDLESVRRYIEVIDKI